MLMLTTTATRAATFARVAGQVLAREARGFDANDPAALLVVAACGRVRDPGRAVVEQVWTLTEPGAADLTLAEVLTERLDAQAASDAWYLEQDTVVRRRNMIETLQELQRFSSLPDWLGSEHAAEMLRVLLGADPAAFLDSETDLAESVADWFDQRRRINRFRARDLAAPLVATLERRHTATWAAQANQLLAAEDHIAAGHPHIYRLARILADGGLASAEDMAELDAPPTATRVQIQQTLLGDYPARRAQAVERDWLALDRRVRRRVTREALAASYDQKNLAVCDTCALAVPTSPEDEGADSRCRYCGAALLDWARRSARDSLATHLDKLRTDLLGHSGQELLSSPPLDHD
jgi:hypothetical protein